MGLTMRLVAGRNLRLEVAVLSLDDFVVVLAVVLDVAGAAELLAGHGLHGRQATTAGRRPPGPAQRPRSSTGDGAPRRFSWPVGTMPGPAAKNSITWLPHPWLASLSWTPTMPSAFSASASLCMRSMASSRAS